MQIDNLSWFPGHMTKTKRMISAEIKNMDAVCEIVDTRIPLSSRNPDVDELTAGKPRLIVLNRADQADPAETRRWTQYFRAQGCAVLRMDTNARNLRARRMYAQLGYREAGIVPCTFNGIPSVQLVCLEKRLEAAE